MIKFVVLVAILGTAAAQFDALSYQAALAQAGNSDVASARAYQEALRQTGNPAAAQLDPLAYQAALRQAGNPGAGPLSPLALQAALRNPTANPRAYQAALRQSSNPIAAAQLEQRRLQAAALRQTGNPGDSVIVRSENENTGDGNYNYLWETSHGTQAEERGYLRANGIDEPFQVSEGSYQYYSPEGRFIRVNYVADENGFRPVVDYSANPQSPPPDVVKTLNLINANKGINDGIYSNNGFRRPFNTGLDQTLANSRRPFNQNVNPYRNPVNPTALAQLLG